VCKNIEQKPQEDERSQIAVMIFLHATGQEVQFPGQKNSQHYQLNFHEGRLP